jgi:hypothetical protein
VIPGEDREGDAKWGGIEYWEEVVGDIINGEMYVLNR